MSSAPPPGPAPVPDTRPAALLGLLRPGLLGGGCPPLLAVLLTFSLTAVVLALYVGLCVAVFAGPGGLGRG